MPSNIQRWRSEGPDPPCPPIDPAATTSGSTIAKKTTRHATDSPVVQTIRGSTSLVVNVVVLVQAASAKASGAVVSALLSLVFGAIAAFLYVSAVMRDFPPSKDPRAEDWIAIGLFGVCAVALLAAGVRLAQLATVKTPSGQPTPEGIRPDSPGRAPHPNPYDQTHSPETPTDQKVVGSNPSERARARGSAGTLS
jgi:hypothetical protein